MGEGCAKTNMKLKSIVNAAVKLTLHENIKLKIMLQQMNQK